jgi:hypothetical protein
MQPTEKQINYALILLRKAGYPTHWMNAKYAELGAKSKQRQGTVTNWLQNMTMADISELIDKLKE